MPPRPSSGPTRKRPIVVPESKPDEDPSAVMRQTYLTVSSRRSARSMLSTSVSWGPPSGGPTANAMVYVGPAEAGPHVLRRHRNRAVPTSIDYLNLNSAAGLAVPSLNFTTTARQVFLY